MPIAGSGNWARGALADVLELVECCRAHGPGGLLHGEGGVDDRPLEPFRERQPLQVPGDVAGDEQIARPRRVPGLDLGG